MAFNGFTKLHPGTVVPVMLMKFLVRVDMKEYYIILVYVLCQNVYLTCGVGGGGGVEQIGDHGVDKVFKEPKHENFNLTKTISKNAFKSCKKCVLTYYTVAKHFNL